MRKETTLVPSLPHPCPELSMRYLCHRGWEALGGVKGHLMSDSASLSHPQSASVNLIQSKSVSASISQVIRISALLSRSAQ